MQSRYRNLFNAGFYNDSMLFVPLNLMFILQAPDYFDIVKKPMDLGTVKSKSKKYEYLNPGDLLRDIHLTFSNCQQYNMPQTAEYKAGQKLQRFFDKRVKELKLETILKSPSKSPKKSPAKGSPSRAANSNSPSTSGASRRSGRRN